MAEYRGRPRNTRRQRVTLDSFDRKILDVLQRNGRMSNAKIALEVGLSESACFNRLKKLEKQEVITQYRAVINQSIIAPHIMVYAHVVLESQKYAAYSKFEQIIAKVSEITRCELVSGQFDYILTVIASDMDDYTRVMEWVMAEHGAMSHYFSYIVMRSTKDEPVLASYLATGIKAEER